MNYHLPDVLLKHAHCIWNECTPTIHSWLRINLIFGTSQLAGQDLAALVLSTPEAPQTECYLCHDWEFRHANGMADGVI